VAAVLTIASVLFSSGN